MFSASDKYRFIITFLCNLSARAGNKEIFFINEISKVINGSLDTLSDRLRFSKRGFRAHALEEELFTSGDRLTLTAAVHDRGQPVKICMAQFMRTFTRVQGKNMCVIYV